MDDESIHAAEAGFVALYAAAREIVASRISEALVAAAGDQIITDDEWAGLVGTHVADEIGDGALDGLIASALTFRTLGAAREFANLVRDQIAGLAEYASNIRLNVAKWIDSRSADDDWSPAGVAKALLEDSPLTDTVAAQVTQTEMNASVNAGLWTGLQEARPAAMRWVTQRDLRVRSAHVVADQDTVLFGELFNIGGYMARFPGDPTLPFALRVNCRCELAPVEGNEVRRIDGMTTDELRARANEAGIAGRSKMTKGDLQHALLKELCLQGLAGGPDCPDRFDQMNRPALLTLARGQGIRGRHNMDRADLIVELRSALRGNDSMWVAQGYAKRAEFRVARQRASYKKGRARADGDGTFPTPAARRLTRQAVLDDFGGTEAGYVPCVHCGLRVSPNPLSGMALLVPEPIIPWSEGGTLAVSNLLPSCAACFQSRGGVGLVSSGAVPRDEAGRWTRAGASTAGLVQSIETEHSGVTLQITDDTRSDRHWSLDRIVIPDDRRGSGEGSAIMAKITGAADQAGVPISLTPEPIGKGSVTALTRFYKRHGFVPNKGRNKLWATRDTMVRYPE